MTRRCLVLCACMGAGHDAVAAELARRLRAHGHDAHVHDVLTLLPPGTGAALRAFYRTVVRRVPALYTTIYRTFLSPAPSRPEGPAAPRADTCRVYRSPSPRGGEGRLGGGGGGGNKRVGGGG
ncbi:hypothetical protein ACE14D_26405, partial [Streptomyces sp. Act-28]